MTRAAATDETACNLCGANEYDVVGRTDREGHRLRTVMCRQCGLVWTNPRPSASDMDRYYASHYRVDYAGESQPALRKILRGLCGARDRRHVILTLLQELTSPDERRDGPLRVLDVGCGAGELVYLLRAAQMDAIGLEPGREYAEFARRVLGVPVQTASVDTATIPPASQDVVTMFHSLEHVADPLQVLMTLRGWLKAGGHLVVEVPNVESTVQGPSHAFHYAHLHHFSGATLGALGQRAGLGVVRIFYSNDGGNVTSVFRRDAQTASVPAWPTAEAARTREVLRGHTVWRHYLSFTPYQRAADRLRRRWREDRLLRRLSSVADLLLWAKQEFRLDSR